MPPDLWLFVDLPPLTQLEITAYIVIFIAFAVFFWVAAQEVSRPE